VTKGPAVDSWPAWSPDGSQIAFVRNGEVFLVPPLAGPERRVAESSGRVAWMPDGSALLVHQKASAFGAQSIFRVSLATGQTQRLTFPNDVSRGDLSMAVSPDSRTIAFCRGETVDGCDIFVMPAGGGEARRLTNDHRALPGLAWTADSREIVFAANRMGRYQLWRVAVDPGLVGSLASPRLVDGAGDDARAPTISRTSKLAYQRFSRNFDIQRVEIAGLPGTPTHRLGQSMRLVTSTLMDATPSWSPDQKKIAFVSNRSGSQELWVCDADGASPLRLTSFGGSSVIFPRWSRFGDRLIFGALTGADGNFEGYTVGATGGAPQRISAPGHRTMAHPVFSRDGRWIYFIPGTQDGPVEAYRMRPKVGQQCKSLGMELSAPRSPPMENCCTTASTTRTGFGACPYRVARNARSWPRSWE
jgi:Tol biopolymer transport system component